MISLKRNKKTGNLETATGLISQEWRKYIPNQKKDHGISRSRFDNFMSCSKCFYLQNIKGLVPSGTPPWRLNTLTDTLLKIEFDKCRTEQKPHRLLIKENLNHIVPFKSKTIKNKKGEDVLEIDVWRNSLSGGIQHRFKKSNIILKGGVDDIWFNTKTEELIIVDYKSQQSDYEVTQDNYFNKKHTDSYKRQLDFYAYLLKGEGYKVSSDAYLYIMNAKQNPEGFQGKLIFDEILIHHKSRTDHIEISVEKMINTMNSDQVPEPNKSCENCAYAKQFSNYLK